MGWKPLDIKHALVRARKNSNFEPQLWSKDSYYFWTKTSSTLVRHKLHMAQTFTTLKSSLITSTNPPLILIIASEIDQWNRLRFVSQFLVFTKYSRKRFFPPEQVSRYVLCTDRYQITSDFSQHVIEVTWFYHVELDNESNESDHAFYPIMTAKEWKLSARLSLKCQVPKRFYGFL